MPPKRSKPGSKGGGSSGRSRRAKSGKGAADRTPSLFASMAPGSAAAGIGSSTGRGGGLGRGFGSGLASGLLGDQSYLRLSTRPLHVLVFLLPLILFYEAAAAFHVIGGEGVEETIRARRILSDFFRVFDVGGIYLPGILVFVVLLLWHFLTRDPWRIRWRVIWLMMLEALVWTPPMLVLGQVLYKLMSGSMGAQPPVSGALESMTHAATALANLGATPGATEAATAAVADHAGAVSGVGSDLASRPMMARAAIAVGAGLYEEMLFRMVGIALFHLILVDLIGMGQRKGTILAVVFAACAFAFYHDVTLGPGVAQAAGVRWTDAGFYIFAGLYFGLVYVWRGFGVVVAVHALYDLAVLLILTRPEGATG